MEENVRETFNEIQRMQADGGDLHAHYQQLDRLLVRVVKQQTAGFKTDFTNFATRLHRLCQSVGHNAYPLEIFRSRAIRIQKGILVPDREDYAYDLKAVCEGIAACCQTTVPEDLQKLLPRHWRHKPDETGGTEWKKRIRITVHHWDKQFIYGKDNDNPTEQLLKVCYAPGAESPFRELDSQLYEGAQLNLLSVRYGKPLPVGDIPEAEHILHPELIVLDPDFLIDITAICACMKPYGHTAYTHLLNKFTPPARSAAIQLGNAANQFLDDCINGYDTDREKDEDTQYMESLRKSFRDAPLIYSTLPDIDRNFFDRCKAQYRNIRRTIQENFNTVEIDIRNHEVQLEPSFLCEALGIQGRMDLLTCDFGKLVELKSGKADEYPYLHPKDEHRLQMALYKEILYYNMERAREKVASYLFYSHYPQLYAADVSRKDICGTIALRNAIVHLERRLRDGESNQLITTLTEDDFNVRHRNDRFYMQYLRPRIMQILTPLQQMQALERAYFHRFLTFIEREQFLAKMGDSRPESCNGFADTWCCDTQTKMQNGNILTGLHLSPVTDEDGSVVGLQAVPPEYDDNFLPNFRQGDMVMLYERNGEGDDVTNKQFFRCLIEEIRPDRILLRLSYKQRNARIFHADSCYAIEPGYMDASFNQACAGLFRLITAPRDRKELLLGLRQPRTDKRRQLCGHYPDETTNAIVLQAKQAEDYFLLIGPPGTGKTSVALKAMVEEFLADGSQQTLLLMAYTNRAVDEICAMLSTLSPEPEYIRIGQELCCEKAYRPRLMKNIIKDARNRQQIYETLAPVRIFTGTISSVCGQMELFNLKPIDIAIIDEASQVLEPQLLPLLCATTEANAGDYNLRKCAIGKFILIGDHKQLPAVVMQPVKDSQVTDKQLHAIGLYDCRNSLFERLHTLQKIQGTEGIVAMLHRQGRMHPALCEFVNRHFYEGKLDIVPLPHQQQDLEWKIYPQDKWHAFVAQTRLGFLHVIPGHTQEYDKSNRQEAEAISRLIQTFRRLYEENGMAPELSKRIGIIVPFRAQIAMIRASLLQQGITEAEDMTIDTVERYQGSQRDIILFSTTVSRYYQLSLLSEPILTDGRQIDRKLNVALTRARKQFFLIGNRDLLIQCPPYCELIGSIPAQDTFTL